MALRVFLLFVLAFLALRAFGRLFRGLVQGASGPRVEPTGRRQAPAAVKMIKDPVCGTFVVPDKALSLTTGGTTHWFCSEACRAQFSSHG